MHCLAINNFCCKTTRDYEREKIMTPENPKDNQECKSDEHTQHLCYFVSYGYHVDNPEEYKDLVEEPRYKCEFCGRTAHLEKSLCMPMKL